MECKYIIIDRVLPIVFSSAILHKDEANSRNITSAGFCNVSVEIPRGYDALSSKEPIIKVDCWGESLTLNNLPSNPERDSKLIKAMLKG